jgi:hypothetical protein
MELEIWKDVVGYEGHYKVSNLGRVISVDRISWNGFGYHKHKGRILTPKDNGHGYITVVLCKNNKPKHAYVHRLVGECFVVNPLNKPEVNHKDGIKNNNNASNLEWVTKSENAYHSFRELGRKATPHPRPKGKNSPHSKAVRQYYLSGEFIKEYGSVIDASIITGIIKTNIAGACRGAAHSAGGYIWRFASDGIMQTKKYEIIQKTGESHHCSRPISKFSTSGEFIRTYCSAVEAGRLLNIDSSSISKVCRGINKHAGGYKWAYL